MLRCVARLVFATLLLASWLYGGCLSCDQYFMIPAADGHNCCDPAGGCKPESRMPPEHKHEGRDCVQQAFALDHQNPAYAVGLFSSMLPPAVLPLAFGTERHFDSGALLLSSKPPDRLSLYSTLLI